MRRRRNPTTIPYYPLLMEMPPSLWTRMRRQRLPQLYRGRRWIKRGYISRLYRPRLFCRPIWNKAPLPRIRPIVNDMSGFEVGITTGPGYRPTFVALPREVVRAFNATMRAFREARYQA